LPVHWEAAGPLMVVFIAILPGCRDQGCSPASERRMCFGFSDFVNASLEGCREDASRYSTQTKAMCGLS
jgi:hypothetical protein